MYKDEKDKTPASKLSLACYLLCIVCAFTIILWLDLKKCGLKIRMPNKKVSTHCLYIYWVSPSWKNDSRNDREVKKIWFAIPITEEDSRLPKSQSLRFHLLFFFQNRHSINFYFKRVPNIQKSYKNCAKNSFILIIQNSPIVNVLPHLFLSLLFSLCFTYPPLFLLPSLI